MKSKVAVGFYREFESNAIKGTVFLLCLVLSGCAGVSGYRNSDPEAFYDRKAEWETQCTISAQSLHPGYPVRRGVVTNYWFTRTYEQCLEKKAIQAKKAHTRHKNG